VNVIKTLNYLHGITFKNERLNYEDMKYKVNQVKKQEKLLRVEDNHFLINVLDYNTNEPSLFE
jgi:hypothetical protein